MVAYNGTVAVLCLASAFVVWRVAPLPPLMAILDLVLGVLNGAIAVRRWRRERREVADQESRSWDEWP